jgi:hypothetical protein
MCTYVINHKYTEQIFLSVIEKNVNIKELPL